MVAEQADAEAELSVLRERFDRDADGVALRELVRALRRQDHDSEALRLLYEHGQSDEARDLLREWLLGERLQDRLMPLLSRPRAGSSPAALVDRAVLCQLQGDLAGAAQNCRDALGADIDYAPGHNHLGRVLFLIGDPAGALAGLRRACQLDPDYAEASNNLGHVLRATGQLNAAREMFERAVRLTPGARTPRLNLGITYYACNDPLAAIEALQRLLHPERIDAEAYRNAGLALHLLGHFEQAHEHYQLALRAAPDDATTCYYAGALLAEIGQPEPARGLLHRALRAETRDVDAWAELAALEENQNRMDAARQAVQQGLAVQADHPPLLLVAAKLQRRADNADQALSSLQSIRPARLPERLAQHYHFELGSVLDRRGDAEAAFAAFSEGNRLAARSPRRLGISPDAVYARIERYREWAERGVVLPDAAREGDTGTDLCFLIGFPRSGTTLLDTLLDVHPDICSIEEKPTLEIARERAEALFDQFPAELSRLDASTLEELRGAYRGALASLRRKAGARLVLDKLPLRTIDAGFARVLFPDARFLFSVRHPCDVVLSNFMQEYAPNEAFIHFDSLESSARLYDAVMQLWAALGPHLADRVHEVRYEQLVLEPEARLREICAFLDIEFRSEMLSERIRNLRENVRTNSYHQVAEPLYARAIERWRGYAARLRPCLPLLAPHAARFGYGTLE